MTGTTGRRHVPRALLIGAGVVLAVLLGFLLLRWSSTSDVEVRGVPGRPLPPAAVSGGAITVRAGDDAADARVLLDGRAVEVVREGPELALRPGPLPDGTHRVSVRVPGLLGSGTVEREFTVDGTPPALHVEDSLRPEAPGEPVTVTGRVEGAAEVAVAGAAVTPDRRGGFAAVVPNPDREVRVLATDAAGNRAERTLTVHTRHPGMRAVHMTGMAWSSATLREPVLELARQGRIDTVELDIKDESGEVAYDSAVPMAERLGADKGYYDARRAIDELHAMGVRVVGRLVAFKDPVLAEASWRGGHPERVVQTADGRPWTSGGYGAFAFTNFADPVVRQYNVDLAAEAAELGFDDVLYDYVRRPDGDLDRMRFPGLTTTPEAGIVEFLRQTQAEVRSRGALLGASVFGIAVDRPTQIAQDIPAMARYVDYIAPMVYPSHWGPGEFGVADPDAQPYEIVRRSLAGFAEAVRGTDVQIIPWLQDFSLGREYGPAEVAAQVDAARDAGMPSFLLWAANCRYTGEALVPGG
ncbi:putative glycoside hydrolase [Saccharopolyspora sp. CA-218241]|uniref:putative glycoside hydrolase n=1 Tax=Saccharopolyspora sp. CA-218241 TaxID=3240027 RepID=UPI003D99AEFE